MKKGNAIIGWSLIIIGLIFFLFGVYYALDISWNQKHGSDDKLLQMPEGLDAAVSSINALLLTNLGAILGISVTMPGSALSRNVLPSSTLKGAEGITPPINSREQIQLTCLVVFLIALIACFVTWIKLGFTSNPQIIGTYVSQSAKMFIGVVLAYLSFILGRT